MAKRKSWLKSLGNQKMKIPDNGFLAFVPKSKSRKKSGKWSNVSESDSKDYRFDPTMWKL